MWRNVTIPMLGGMGGAEVLDDLSLKVFKRGAAPQVHVWPASTPEVMTMHAEACVWILMFSCRHSLQACCLNGTSLRHLDASSQRSWSDRVRQWRCQLGVISCAATWRLSSRQHVQGGGEVSIRIPALPKLPPVSLTEEGMRCHGCTSDATSLLKSYSSTFCVYPSSPSDSG